MAVSLLISMGMHRGAQQELLKYIVWQNMDMWR